MLGATGMMERDHTLFVDIMQMRGERVEDHTASPSTNLGIQALRANQLGIHRRASRWATD